MAAPPPLASPPSAEAPGGVAAPVAAPIAAPEAAPEAAPIAAPAAAPIAPSLGAPNSVPIARATAGFMLRHPAHALALGFGSGLSPKAPGTVGTLWAWVSYLVFSFWLGPVGWAWVIGLGTLAGWWACTRTAQHLRIADPGAIVWDEVLAFWLVLWLLMPASWELQLAAFALFRYFDAAKPGPVRWADRRFKLQRGEAIGWRQGFGILFDDFVAALCTLLVLALWVRVWN